ncbi:MAG: hypothetical protein U0797_14825 [Gemmataceae bacterium]
MMQVREVTRRDALRFGAAASVGGGTLLATEGKAGGRDDPKTVAAVITVYCKGSHADVLVGKILEGWKQDGGPGPALKLAAMYVDQFPADDMARGLAARYKVPIFDTVEKALTLGGDRVAVDGVISIGEHGDYPWNDKGQHLYPRRRFFEQITAALEKGKRVVPVFNDKHLGPAWADAKWMYDRARALNLPFMAGSSLPLTFRSPDLPVPLGGEIEAAVGIGYSGLDIYGSHALECYQCLVERRRGGEQGVRSVQCLQGEAMWKAVDAGAVPKDVLEAALAAVPHRGGTEMRKDEGASLFQFQYIDGFPGAVLMLPRSAGGTAVALRVKGKPKPVATRFEERTEPRHPHFAYLLKAIERMIHTGRASYPVERTLLTSGVLDRALTSLAQGQKKLTTPELAIRYRPVDYPHAPRPELTSDPSGG